MMAATAKYRDDIAGAIVTGGSSTSYTLSSYQQFDSFTSMSGAMIAFTPHVTNGTITVINVDGLGSRPLRTAPGVELQAGVIIQGTPYAATYNNSDAAWYLRGFFGNPYNVPLAAGMDYWGSTAPNSSFVFPIGQAISRATYAALFAAMGTTFGIGDGTTTFNLPDKRGRVSAAADGGVGRLSGATVNSTALGGIGGSETHTLTVAEIPSHTHANTLSDAGHSHVVQGRVYGGFNGNAQSPVAGLQLSNGVDGNVVTDTRLSNIALTNAAVGGSAAHAILQPTILCNYIIRII